MRASHMPHPAGAAAVHMERGLPGVRKKFNLQSSSLLGKNIDEGGYHYESY